MKILVINGPNINMLGNRETSIYGLSSYSELIDSINLKAKELNIDVNIFQSNIEGEIIDCIQNAKTYDYIIINAAAYTHTSIAIRDALLAVNIKFIEVHISNIYKRENFRHKSYLSDIAVGVISGFGTMSYILALEYAAKGV